MDSHGVLSQKSLVVIFTYAPAGLGHLRVTDALSHGLPKDVNPVVLGANDSAANFLHRLSSIHPVTRRIMEWWQCGKPEDVMTFLYRGFLRGHASRLYDAIAAVLEQRIHLPETLLLVSTHFGLAHELSAIKEKISRSKNVRVILVVQVTDDSPQHLWYVPGADMIVVPSERTRNALLDYGRSTGLAEVRFEVMAYPLSPELTQKLSEDKVEERLRQVDRAATQPIHMAVPISGAAVGTQFLTTMIRSLHSTSNRFIFHVISRQAFYTQSFLREMRKLPYVTLYTSRNDREIVDTYEQVYRKQPISLEVTKPSEQAFKALVSPGQIGGSLLLFSTPVGRQEYDNLDFLRRHRLIPQTTDQAYLWEQARTTTHAIGSKGALQNNLHTISHGNFVSSVNMVDAPQGVYPVRAVILNNRKDYLGTSPKDKQLHRKAVAWRGVVLPDEPVEAAAFIWWCLKSGIFRAMMDCTVRPQPDDRHAHELNPDGTEEFWRRVAQLLRDSIIP